MTLDEKRKKLREHCDELWNKPFSDAHGCDLCPLFTMLPLKDRCHEEGADIERNYALVFGWDDQNPYWERICKLADKQRAKGMETYGQGLEMNPADMLKRIEHLQEELIDGLMYCEWIKDKLMELEGKA